MTAPENGAAAFSVTVTGTLYQSESVNVLDSAELFAFTPMGNNWNGGPASSETFFYQANPGQTPGTETITAVDGSLSAVDGGIVTIPANVITGIAINDNTSGSGVQAPENGAATLTVTVTGTLYQQESVDLADDLGLFGFTQIGDSWTGGPTSSETLTYQANAGATPGTETITATDGTNSSISTTDPGIVTIPANVVTSIAIDDGNDGSGVQAPENGVAAFSVIVTGTLYQSESVNVSDSLGLFGFTPTGNDWNGGPTSSETFFYQANAGATPGTETITAVDGTNSSISTADPGIVTIPSNVITGISINDNTGGNGVQAAVNGAANFSVTVTGTLYQQESVNVADSASLFGFTQTGNDWSGGPTSSETFYYTANAGQTPGTETITAVDGSDSSISTTDNGIVTGNVVTGIFISTTNPTGDVQAPVNGATTFTVTITGSLYQAQPVNITESAGLFGGSIALIGDSASTWSSTGGPYSTEVLTYQATAGGTPGSESMYATTTDSTGATYPASITADVVQVQSITVADGAGTGPTVPVTGISSNTVYYTRNADGTASINLTSVVVPPSTAGYAATQYQLIGPSGTQSGQLAASMSISLPAPPNGTADAFQLETGTDINNTFIATQSINLAAHNVTLNFVKARGPGTAAATPVRIKAGTTGPYNNVAVTEDGGPADPGTLVFAVAPAGVDVSAQAGVGGGIRLNINATTAGPGAYAVTITSRDDPRATLTFFIQVF